MSSFEVVGISSDAFHVQYPYAEVSSFPSQYTENLKL